MGKEGASENPGELTLLHFVSRSLTPGFFHAFGLS